MKRKWICLLLALTLLLSCAPTVMAEGSDTTSAIEAFAASVNTKNDTEGTINSTVFANFGLSTNYRFYYKVEDGTLQQLKPEAKDIECDAASFEYNAIYDCYLVTPTDDGNGELSFTYNGVKYCVQYSFSLPNFALYRVPDGNNTPVRSAENYIGSDCTGTIGEDVEVYGMWNPRTYTAISKIDDVDITDVLSNNEPVTIATADGVDVTYSDYNPENGYIKVSTTLLTSTNADLEMQRNGSTRVEQIRFRPKANMVVGDITYGLKKSANNTYLLTAVKNANSSYAVDAPEALKNVQELVVEIYNYTDLNTPDYQGPEKIVVELLEPDENGEGEWGFALLPDETAPYYEAIVVYSLLLKDGTQLGNSFFVYNYPDTSITVELKEDNYSTADELNELLSKDAASLAKTLLTAAEQKAFENVATDNNHRNDPELHIKLPAVSYEEIIVYQVDDSKYSLKVYLEGTTEASESGLPGTDINLTVIPGLVITGGCELTYLMNIDIAYDAEVEKTFEEGKSYYDYSQQELNEDFTFGILAHNSSSLGVTRFVNVSHFDYGMRASDTGNIGSCTMNTLSDNGTAIRLDSDNCTGGSVFTAKYTRFDHNGIAVHIEGLPEYQDVYACRVEICDFIDNDSDFRVDVKGWFYFYNNYFELNGALQNETRGVLTQGTDTILHTHPRRLYPATDYENYREYYYNSDCPLYVANDFEDYAALRNDQADSLTIAEVGEGAELTIVDGENTALGTWEF